MLYRIFPFFVVLFCICGFSACKMGAKLPHITKLKNGDKFTYRLHRDTDIEMNLNGRDQISTHKQTLDLEYELIEEMPDGSMKFDLVYSTIKIWQVNGFRTLSFDSETEGARENLEFNKQIFKEMLGKKVSMTVGANGDILQFNGASRIIDNFFKDIKNMELLGFYRAVREQMGDLAMKEMLGQLHFAFPSKELKIEEVWESQTSQISGIGILKKNVFQLKKANANGTEIRLKAVVEPNPNARVVKMGNNRVKFFLNGFESGIYRLPRVGARVDNATIDTKLSGTATITREDNMVFPARVVVRMQTVFEKL